MNHRDFIYTVSSIFNTTYIKSIDDNQEQYPIINGGAIVKLKTLFCFKLGQIVWLTKNGLITNNKRLKKNSIPIGVCQGINSHDGTIDVLLRNI